VPDHQTLHICLSWSARPALHREDFTMSNAKKEAPKRRRGAKVVPVLGAVGLLLLTGGAFAATSGTPVADLPTQKTAPNQEIILS